MVSKLLGIVEPVAGVELKSKNEILFIKTTFYLKINCFKA